MTRRTMTRFSPRGQILVLAVIAAEVILQGRAFCAGEAAASRPAAPAAQDKVRERGDYQIGAEDVLDIAVWNNTAISRTVPVRPDGMISLPLLNDVQAAGLTPMELRDVLVRKLTDYMPAPEVSVIVREVHSCKITVMGEVKNPGRYEIRSHATVLDAIEQAGGFTDFAVRSRLAILRPDGRTLLRIPIKYKQAVSGSSDEERIALKPGDTIVVP
ncbi:MAG TPA: polysaccharide biosynthesis/export family protein [Verrucomicrobiae bacterium]|nr:polysaccharide biosynthesis/export family protein [Verrucomicrobiae bacterium]